MIRIPAACAIGLAVALATTTSACGSSPTEPGASTNAFPTDIRVYSSPSVAGPWAGPQVVTISGHGVRGVVDASPILMADGTIFLYYSMANDDHLVDVPSIGVAQSADGLNFSHRAVAHAPGNVSDPFPLLIDGGYIRLFFSQRNPRVMSATSTSPAGLAFTADEGARSTIGGVPGALRVGSTYFLYVKRDGEPMSYMTSTDGLTFAPGGPTGLAGGSPSPIDAGDGTYLMSYTCSAQDSSTDARTHESCLASSLDGRTWTETTKLGPGSVPGLVRDGNGLLRVYVVGFPPR
jgi:hypothetical protein